MYAFYTYLNIDIHGFLLVFKITLTLLEILVFKILYSEIEHILLMYIEYILGFLSFLCCTINVVLHGTPKVLVHTLLGEEHSEEV